MLKFIDYTGREIYLHDESGRMNLESAVSEMERLNQRSAKHLKNQFVNSCWGIFFAMIFMLAYVLFR